MHHRSDLRVRISKGAHTSRTRSVFARYRRPKLRAGFVVLTIAVLFCPLALGGVASAKTVSPLKKGLQFYAGQTLTFIANTTAGSNNDIEARIITVGMGQYLHATINVVDDPAGGNITGQDVMASSTPNGLTFGYLGTGGDILNTITDTTGLNFNPSRLAFLGTIAPPDHMLLVSETSPYKTFAQMLKAPASDPVTLISDTGATTLEQYLLLKAFNINARVIPGYANTAAMDEGFIRGDGMGMLSSTGAAGSYLVANQAYGVWVNSRLPARVNYSAATSKVPTLAQLAAKYPPKTKIAKEALETLEDFQANSGYLFVAPSATPTPQLTALRAALKHALGTKSVQTQLYQIGYAIDAISGPAAKTGYLKSVAAINKYAGPLDLSAAGG
jgi:tripartite-type tricarboxylate transporter receptor subunit TctC